MAPCRHTPRTLEDILMLWAIVPELSTYTPVGHPYLLITTLGRPPYLPTVALLRLRTKDWWGGRGLVTSPTAALLRDLGEHFHSTDSGTTGSWTDLLTLRMAAQ